MAGGKRADKVHEIKDGLYLTAMKSMSVLFNGQYQM